MAGRKVLKWLEAGWKSFVDPQKEERIQLFSKQIHRLLAEHRTEFDFEKAIRDINIESHDVHEVKRRVYKTCVERAWNDLELTDKESRSLEWVAKKLSLSDEDRADINKEHGEFVIERLLSSMLEDGKIDDSEYQRIVNLAKWMREEPSNLTRSALSKSSSGLVRSIFMSAISDGDLSSEEWHEITLQAERLGVGNAEFKQIIEHQANSFVEGVFASARSDGELSPDEERQIQWLVTKLIVDPKHKKYFGEELEHFRRMTQIAKGSLPSLPCPVGITLKSGELVHGDCPVRYTFTKQLKSGPVTESIRGEAVITDSRLIIIGESKSFELPYRSVVACFVEEEFTELRCSSRSLGAGTYRFTKSPELHGAILDCAIRRSKQTVVDTTGEHRSRVIPRDVRQRVWVRFGGRCADCGADQYLEFDHIVPFSKGGSNTDQNVQLLCRRCNLKKLDAI